MNLNYEEIYKPFEQQLEVHKDRHRFRVLVCGRRFGKTTLAVNELIVNALKQENSKNWYVAPTYRQAKQISWQMLLHYLPREAVLKTNETELKVELYNKATIELKGADNPDSLRGVGINFLIVDEVASIRNWDWVWKEVLRATITDTGGNVLFIGTPKGFNHFHKMYLEGQGENPDYKSWRFKSTDSPYFREDYEKLKRELSADYLAQEYEADFRKYVGLVYKDFNRETHVIDPFNVPEEWRIYRAIDFGSTNPTACLWIAVDSDENIYIVGEHYETGQTIDYHAGVIRANQFSGRVVSTYGDPSGAQWIQEFAERGIYITPANKEVGTNIQNWVRFGIEKISERLVSMPGHDVHLPEHTLHNGCSLYIFRGCENTINEVEHYRWKEKLEGQAKDLNEPDMPEKANDHAMDALRYFAVSYKKETETPEDFNVDKKNWSFR